MGDPLSNLLVMSSAGSAAVLLVLLLGPVTEKYFPAKRQYQIWKAALFFFLVPVSFWIGELSFPSPSLIGGAELPPALNGLESSPWIPRVSGRLKDTLFVLWLAGAAVFAAWQLYCRRRFWSEIRSGGTSVGRESKAAAVLASCKRELGIRGGVSLVRSSRVASPMLVGILHPVVLLPPAEAEMGAADLKLVLTHELIHLKKKDLFLKSLALCAGALHWYNPFVHVMRKKIALWSEFACDEAVVSGMSRAERERYGEAILNALSPCRKRETVFCSALSGNGEQLKKRLVRILNFRKKEKSVAVFAVLAALVIFGAGTGAVFAPSGWEDTDGKPASVPVLTRAEQTDNLASEEAEPVSGQSGQELKEEIHQKAGMRVDVKVGSFLDPESNRPAGASDAG
jgi:beta-lactamase regulating signal transducer with metallopeptidase domain